jgi:isopentenyl-diphosphate delta-isomerase type 1
MKDDLQELFVVVNESDQILGYRTRYDCHHDKRLMHRVSGVVIFDAKGRILLQKRSMNKDLNPGQWGISAAGHVMKGESYREAAHREMNEEIGVSVPIKFLKKFISRTTKETEMDSVFRADYDGPFHIAKNEVEEVRFFTKRELVGQMKTGKIICTQCTLITLKEIGYL